MTKLRLILATHNPLTGSRLARDLEGLSEIDLRGRASDLSAIYTLAERHEPDVALIGRDLCRLPDFEGLRALFRLLGTAMVEVGDTPADGTPLAPGMAPRALRDALLGLRRPAGDAPPPLALHRKAPPATQPGQRGRADRIILIGASTGGIDALLRILADLPADGPPAVIVQHTGTAFSDSLIRLFARCAPGRVLAAQNGIRLKPGLIIVGAGCGGHVTLGAGTWPAVLVTPGPPVSGHMPSIDALFHSALPMARQIVAALLTGMGRDGARGLLDLRLHGARTLAQDEASSVVYGMPRAAVELGAAERIVPLSSMAATLLQLCRPPLAEPARR